MKCNKVYTRILKKSRFLERMCKLGILEDVFVAAFNGEAFPLYPGGSSGGMFRKDYRIVRFV